MLHAYYACNMHCLQVDSICAILVIFIVLEHYL